MKAAGKLRDLSYDVRLRAPWSGRSSRDSEPSRALFGRIRWRLALWYSGVLAAVLILSGVILYFGVRQVLLGPIQQQLQTSSQTAAYQFQQDPPTDPVNPFNQCPDLGDLLVACYGPTGKLVGWSHSVRALTGVYGGIAQFATNNALASTALEQGHASDSLHVAGGQGDYAALQRTALKVTGSNGSTLGVVQVGIPVGTRLAALDTLLRLMLIVGAFTLLFSAAAGLFLASRALQPAKIAYRRQRDFIADASHELRTPLTMLRSTVEFILRGSNHLPPDDVALLKDAVMETSHLTNLANNMLSLARLESDQSHIEDDVVNLGDLASEVVKWAEPLAAERDIAVTVETAETILVIADQSMIEQASLILLDNAIKYNRPHGQVNVRVSKENATAVLEVRDTGIGIASQHLAHLGERFYRVDKARSRESGGAGLGLSIVRTIASRHGGSFEIDSEEDVGSTARLALPAVETRGYEAPATSEEPASPR